MYVVQDSTLALSQSMASGFNSGIWETKGMAGGSIEMSWTSFNGTTSTIVLQGSNSGLTWCDIEGTSFTLATGSTGDKYITITEPWLKKIRAVYTAGNATTGTITMVGSSWVVLDQGQPGGNAR